MSEPLVRPLRFLAPLLILPLLGGCKMVLLNPSGDVAVQQRDLLLVSTGLMLLIIVPVIAATALFAWHYRASNTRATYTPEWSHSTQVEVLIWTAPLLIIIALGALTWISTHVLDPFRPIERTAPGEPVMAGVKPLTIEVVSLDWKWVFFYPDQGIATVNELAAPLDMPIAFRLTSATVMNTFFVPALAGQIYAMAGMQTKLSAVMNKEGTFDGFSANYSGAGFSNMRFKFHSLTQAGFQDWVAKVKAQGQPLDLDTYRALSRPSEAVPVTYYSTVRPGLYEAILNLCVEPGKMCLGQMMAIDAKGGQKTDDASIREQLKYDGAGVTQGNEAPGATFPASGRPPNTNVQPQGMNPRPLSPTVNQQKTAPDEGQGHAMDAMPGMAMPEAGKPNPAPAQLNDH